jgi:matrix metalloproteinase-14 (membrane-inserted)
VAVHELGHALGLEHSDNYDAIMAPFFRGYTDDFSLHSDDKIAIQMLYGPKKPKATPSVSLFTLKSLIPQVDPRLSYLCSDGEFDAITQLSDLYTYIFKGAYVYKFDFERKLFRGYPKRINSVFRDWSHSGFISLPSNLDAVLYVPENKTTYFFKNNLYWKSSVLFEIDQGFPRLIYSDFKGLNSRNGFNGKLDAVFVWSGNRRTYFVSGNKYWRYDFSTGWIENGYPKDFSYWNGLNSKISNAFLYSDEKTYFFKNNVFYRFNDQSFKIDTEFLPRLNSEYWFMCQ